MKNILLLTTLLFLQLAVAAQITIRGKITDKSGLPLIGANVVAKGTYDGTSTDTTGSFKFQTDATDSLMLEVSYIGYETLTKRLAKGQTNISLQLHDAGNTLDDITITAGAFQASDKKKGVTLKPLDIMTTAGASGDLYGGIKTLPGVNQVGEDGRLFVRGGDGYETKTFIDGLEVKKPYDSSTPDLPSRGRFSPWLFSGTLFSTGGYSAEYGGALSSALILETSGKTNFQQTGLSLMTVGLGASHTELFKNGSVSVSLDYTNLAPYFKISNHKRTYEKAPEAFGGTVVVRRNIGEKGLLKVMTSVSTSSLKLSYPNMEGVGSTTKVKLNDQDIYVNVAYTHDLGSGWTLKPGISLSSDNSTMEPGVQRVEEKLRGLNAKLVLKKRITQKVGLSAGAELVSSSYIQNYENSASAQSFHGTNTAMQYASFVEMEWIAFKKLAFRLGERVEYWETVGRWNAAPRLSAAWQLNEWSQISLSAGRFFQRPEDQHLRFNDRLNFENATHFIAGYQLIKDNRTFRIEGYQKTYGNLVRYDTDFTNPELYNNGGSGIAQGIDLFLRDQKTVKNLDYWISYSYIESKRLYKDYPEKVTPSFLSKHNFTLNSKYFISKLRSQLGMTASYHTGRPYNNPNLASFMSETAPDYFDLSLSVTYLTNISKRFTVIYASVSNVLGTNQVYTYRYYNTPNNQGVYDRIKVTPDSKRFFVIGCFIDLKKSK
jgi:hypothetical protein